MLPTAEPVIPEESPEHLAFKQFLELTLRKREIGAELEEAEARLRALEPQILAYLGETGYDKIRIEGYTLSPHREPWVYPAGKNDKKDVIEALKASGLKQYVSETYSTKSLTKYVRDLEDEAGLRGANPEETLAILPPKLAAVIKIEPSFRVQVTKTWR